MRLPLLSCIVPLYNGLALTQAMLASLHASLSRGPAYEVILIDDGSSDGTRAWLGMLRDARVKVLLNERNLRYAGANNRGAREARGHFLALLNNDLLLTEGWLQPMLDLLREPLVGLVGNLQYRVDDGQLDHAGIEATREGKLTHVRALPPKTARARDVFAVTAACCLVRKRDFLRVGGFDEAYENGGEDVDLCLRLRARGLRTVVCLKSSVRHHVSAARGPVGLRDERNSRRLLRAWPKQIETAVADAWIPSLLHQDSGLRLPLRARLLARLRLRRLPVPLPRQARLFAQSALGREEARWCTLFGELPTHAEAAVSDFRMTGLRNDTREFPDISLEIDPTRRPLVRFPWIDRDLLFDLPGGFPTRNLILFGFVCPEDPENPYDKGPLGLRLTVNDTQVVSLFPLPPGPFRLDLPNPLVLPAKPSRFQVELLGVAATNRRGLLGRLCSWLPLPSFLRERLEPYRRRHLNRRLRLTHVIADDERLFELRQPFTLPARLRLRGQSVGLNVVGWLRAELGIGESARCMARACDAAKIPAALIDLKLPCLNRAGDESFSRRLQEDNPHPVNIFHNDPPVSCDIDHHHGSHFRPGKYNIAYWAWELPAFPHEWALQAGYFDEIWCPSDFVRSAIASTVTVPVHVLPHAIQVPAPSRPDRRRFNLPPDRFLFLFLYDLNSYQERKNPLGVIEAFRRAFPNPREVGLVIKTQNPERNREAFERLQFALAGLETQVHLIAKTLSRAEVYALEAACDVFVSLHRSEGFGLAVAECMALGKAVVSTDWSATSEFVNSSNGCPVRARLVTLDRDHGPYKMGNTWADPDLDHAAWHLKRLANDPTLARSLGERAAADLRAHYSPEAIGRRYLQRLGSLGLKIP